MPRVVDLRFRTSPPDQRSFSWPLRCPLFFVKVLMDAWLAGPRAALDAVTGGGGGGGVGSSGAGGGGDRKAERSLTSAWGLYRGLVGCIRLLLGCRCCCRCLR